MASIPLIAQRAAPACEPGNGGLTLPPGFCALVIADNLGVARNLVVAPNGDIFVSVRSGPATPGQPRSPGYIVGLRDTNGDGKIDMQEKFGTNGATGIVLRNGYLYYSTTTSIERFKLNPGELKPAGPAEVIVGGFPRAARTCRQGHRLRRQGQRLRERRPAVERLRRTRPRSQGAKGLDPCPQLDEHGGIWKFSADTPGQTFSAKNRYATGLRQGVALAWYDGHLYVAMNSRDSLDTIYPEHVHAGRQPEPAARAAAAGRSGRRLRLAVLLLRRAGQQDDPRARVRRRRQGDRPLRAVQGAGRDLPRALRAGRSHVHTAARCCRRSTAAGSS